VIISLAHASFRKKESVVVLLILKTNDFQPFSIHTLHDETYTTIAIGSMVQTFQLSVLEHKSETETNNNNDDGGSSEGNPETGSVYLHQHLPA
jgi:hypothetical protein